MQSKLERDLVRILVRVPVAEEQTEVEYRVGSFEGLPVTPTDFYPPVFIDNHMNKKRERQDGEFIPTASELRIGAPRDARINAYILGDSVYFSPRSVFCVSGRPSQPGYGGSIASSESYGTRETDLRGACITYCRIPQEYLNILNKNIKSKSP